LLIQNIKTCVEHIFVHIYEIKQNTNRCELTYAAYMVR